jgi:hypothetical protein
MFAEQHKMSTKQDKSLLNGATERRLRGIRDLACYYRSEAIGAADPTSRKRFLKTAVLLTRLAKLIRSNLLQLERCTNTPKTKDVDT